MSLRVDDAHSKTYLAPLISLGALTHTLYLLCQQTYMLMLEREKRHLSCNSRLVEYQKSCTVFRFQEAFLMKIYSSRASGLVCVRK
jgi:hypothetical protein